MQISVPCGGEAAILLVEDDQMPGEAAVFGRNGL
jgi:hypothetical protein